MIVLSANNLRKAYGTDVILDSVSFHLNEGDRVGIIGNNGAGKSTLLNMITGSLPRDDGDVFVAQGKQVGYLRQNSQFDVEKTVYEEMINLFSDLIEMERQLESLSVEISKKSESGEDVDKMLHQYDDMAEAFKERGGYSYKSEITGILNSMAFPESYYDKRIATLSGGERTRLALAALLLQKPDVLLLDEPTNHLDIGTLKWLEQYLKNYSGTMVVISHDRYFLDETVNRIFEVENTKLYIYEGNYSAYAEKKRQLRDAAMNLYEQQQKEIKRQEEIIRRFKQHGTEKLAKRAQSREKRLAHLDRVDRPEDVQGHMRIRFKQKFKSGNDVLYVENLAKGFGHGQERRELFRNVNMDVKSGERICMVGANGIGKTTLLKILKGDLAPDVGYVKPGHNVQIGYYDQEQETLSMEKTILDEMTTAYRLYSDTEMRSILGRFLFSGDVVFQRISTLSGGEKARLSLLKLMLSGANTLMMDEPTNHLDISSKEVFEDALLDYPGTLIAISHDRYFLKKIATRILELTADGMDNYLGSYDYYVEKKESIGSTKKYMEELTAGVQAADSDINDGEDTNVSGELSAAEQRLVNKQVQAEEKRRKRQLEQLEAKIAEFEEEIAETEAIMCTEEIFSDHKKLAEHDEKLSAAKAMLAETYDAWLDIHDA